jgi:Firmicute plasmid replication protein (RepL)
MENKKDYKKIVHEKVEQVTDILTGEIIRQKTYTKSIVEREPDFVKLYLKDVIRLKELPKNTENVLNLLLKSMSYKNIIPAYAPIKRMICNELNMQMNTLNKSIDNLYKAGLLIRVERGIYMADPNLFGKGEWKDIQALRLVIDYNKDGTKQISGEKMEQLKLF